MTVCVRYILFFFFLLSVGRSCARLAGTALTKPIITRVDMQIVCIAEGTYKPGLNEIGDIVARHEDDVLLSGSGYASMEIIKVSSMTVSEYDTIAKAKIPEISRVYRLDARQNTWTLSNPEEKQVWRNADEKWCDLVSMPKYALNINLTAQDKEDLANTGVSKEIKSMILAKMQEKIHLDSKNLIEVADLNAEPSIL